MVRKVKATTTYNNLTQEDVSSIVLATSGKIKDKEVDPRKVVGTIHIKKYLADAKINGKVETWISIVKKLTASLEEGKVREELTAEEVETLEQCKAETLAYLEDEASEALKKKVSESTDEYQNLKDISSSMKFKFSRYAYEVITHAVNLMTREILTFTCDGCASQKAKLTKVAHIPWHELQTKMLSGLYMNTKAVFDSVHPSTEEVETEEAAPVDDVEAPVETSETEEPEVEEEAKVAKPRLSQYISNTFKEIVSRDERFKGLLLGKEITALVNEIIYQALDRYANVIKSLLQTANSKTVNERLAIIATKILLQDHTHSTDEDLEVVLDIIQSRIEDLKAVPEEEPTTEAPVEPAPESPKKAKQRKA